MGEIKKLWQTTTAGSLADRKLSPGHSSRLREIRLLQSRKEYQPAKHLPRWEKTPCWPDLGKHSSTDGGESPGLKSGDFCSSPAASFVMLCYLGEAMFAYVFMWLTYGMRSILSGLT